MVHEAMVLEASGPRPGLGRARAWLRLAVLLGLGRQPVLPWGVATEPVRGAAVGGLALTAKVAVLAACSVPSRSGWRS